MSCYRLIVILLILLNTHTIFAFKIYPRQAEAPQTIVFMRHAEREPQISGQLNCKGLNRAISLPKVLLTKFGKPNTIFAANPYALIGDPYGIYYYVTTVTTIEPTAILLKMPVNLSFSYFEVPQLVKELIKPKYHHSLIFVAWEHKNIVFLAKSLMIIGRGNPEEIPNWTSQNFDSLYVLTLDWSYGDHPKVTFTHDSEGLDNGSDKCPQIIGENQAQPKIKPSRTERIFAIVPEVEESELAIGQLSCKGLNRAIALTQRLYALYTSVDAFYIPPPTNRSNPLLRTLLTLEPTAIEAQKYFKMINKGFTMNELNCNFDGTDDGSGKKCSFDHINIIAWPIDDLPNIARKIYKHFDGNPSDIPSPVPSLDSIYQITINGIGKPSPHFAIVNEYLNNVPDNCP